MPIDRAEPPWLLPEDGNLSTYLNAYLALADAAVDEILARRRSDVPVDTIPVNLGFSEVEKLVRGGKKLRGALIALGFAIAGGDAGLRRAVVEASIGYECLHNALLIHDDIMDRATVRRGQPTAWRVFANTLPEDGDHYGVAQAINLGDMIAYWLPALVAQKAFRPERVIEAIQIISHAVQTTVIGQMLDVDPDITILLPSDERLMDILRCKTAVYTIVAPLQMGAVLGNMRQSTRAYQSIERFGLPVGMAFQLQDDILGVYGTESQLGKSVTSDLSEGKKTLLFWELHRRLDPHDQKRFMSTFGNQDVTEADVTWVRDKGRQTGALGAVQQRAQELITQATSVISDITADIRARLLLKSVADFVIERRF
jgi:geranylgeranyl diphosphate synthase type I